MLDDRNPLLTGMAKVRVSHADPAFRFELALAHRGSSNCQFVPRGIVPRRLLMPALLIFRSATACRPAIAAGVVGRASRRCLLAATGSLARWFPPAASKRTSPIWGRPSNGEQ